MSRSCSHQEFVRTVTPSARGCEECLKTASWWVHLRICRSCGHVGCCDQSPGKHATKHSQTSGYPFIEDYDPPEGWGWCYVDETFTALDHPTPQVGLIPRFVGDQSFANHHRRHRNKRRRNPRIVSFFGSFLLRLRDLTAFFFT